LIIAESSGAVANGTVSSAVTETATSSTIVKKSSSSSRVIEFVFNSSSSVVTGGTTEFVTTSESQQLQQGTTGQHSTLVITQTQRENSTAINQENLSTKHEVSAFSGSVSESPSTVKKEPAPSSCNSIKSLSNQTSSDIQNKSKQELDESLAIAEKVSSYVQESSSSVI
jgi:hypothetical protein